MLQRSVIQCNTKQCAIRWVLRDLNLSQSWLQDPKQAGTYSRPGAEPVVLGTASAWNTNKDANYSPDRIEKLSNTTGLANNHSLETASNPDSMTNQQGIKARVTDQYDSSSSVNHAASTARGSGARSYDLDNNSAQQGYGQTASGRSGNSGQPRYSSVSTFGGSSGQQGSGHASSVNGDAGQHGHTQSEGLGSNSGAPRYSQANTSSKNVGHQTPSQSGDLDSNSGTPRYSHTSTFGSNVGQQAQSQSGDLGSNAGTPRYSHTSTFGSNVGQQAQSQSGDLGSNAGTPRYSHTSTFGGNGRQQAHSQSGDLGSNSGTPRYSQTSTFGSNVGQQAHSQSGAGSSTSDTPRYSQTSAFGQQEPRQSGGFERQSGGSGSNSGQKGHGQTSAFSATSGQQQGYNMAGGLSEGQGLAAYEPVTRLPSTGIPPVFHPPSYITADTPSYDKTIITEGGNPGSQSGNQSQSSDTGGVHAKEALQPLTEVTSWGTSSNVEDVNAKQALQPLTQIPVGNSDQEADAVHAKDALQPLTEVPAQEGKGLVESIMEYLPGQQQTGAVEVSTLLKSPLPAHDHYTTMQHMLNAFWSLESCLGSHRRRTYHTAPFGHRAVLKGLGFVLRLSQFPYISVTQSFLFIVGNMLLDNMLL